MRTLAVITARGGSKGLKNKNIKNLYNKPLIAWTIESAIKTPEISKVIVSTDCDDIMQISKQFGANVPFKRPDFLASDSASSIDVVIHAVEFLENQGEFFDFIVLLEPTSPLRKKDDLSKAIQLYETNQNSADGVISMGKIHLENPFITKKINAEGFLEPLIENDIIITQRQQYPEAYFPYGVVYGVKTEVLKEKKIIYTEKSIPYLIERWQNFEIDDVYDFMCIEKVFENKIEEILR